MTFFDTCFYYCFIEQIDDDNEADNDIPRVAYNVIKCSCTEISQVLLSASVVTGTCLSVRLFICSCILWLHCKTAAFISDNLKLYH